MPLTEHKRDLCRFMDTDGVHVWRINLDQDADRIAALRGCLSPDERARGERLLSARDRSRFLAARGSLRAILGSYLNVTPEEVRIALTPERKPILADGHQLQFNLSHSDALALVAVAFGRPVGVDLERVRTDFQPDTLARRFFSPAEAAALGAAPPAEKHRLFLRYWTSKEAYLKAVGTGLSSPLDQFTVSLEEHSILLASPADTGIAAPYYVRPLLPAPGYVAALAVACEENKDA